MTPATTLEFYWVRVQVLSFHERPEYGRQSLLWCRTCTKSEARTTCVTVKKRQFRQNFLPVTSAILMFRMTKCNPRHPTGNSPELSLWGYSFTCKNNNSHWLGIFNCVSMIEIFKEHSLLCSMPSSGLYTNQSHNLSLHEISRTTIRVLPKRLYFAFTLIICPYPVWYQPLGRLTALVISSSPQ